MRYRKAIENIKPYKPGLSDEEIKKKNNIDKVIKLASNENPYGASKNVKRVFENIDRIEIYPDNYCTELREKIAKKLEVSEKNFIFGNGSVEIIQMITRAFIDKDDEIITCIPTF